ncbi:MAG: PadR family transcriptional regulator [Acidobacteriota bacterium]
MKLEREWLRGAAPLAIMTLLDRQEMYGYELCTALERDSGNLLGLGQSTVYTALYSLESRGLVAVTERAAETGRRRKYYRLTEAGERWLETHVRQWQLLAEALHRLGVGQAGPQPEAVPT